MAQHAIQTRDYERAIKFYKEALSHNENDGKVPEHDSSLSVFCCIEVKRGFHIG